MATQLSIYNDALLICGERFLGSLTEAREPRRLLDQVWNTGGIAGGGAVRCLQEGDWEFAMRTVEIDYDPAQAPPFGYQFAFDKPSDWIATWTLASDEFFTTPLNRYSDEAGFWYSDLNTIYVQYVSSDPGYGMNMANWPATFNDFVAAHFASKIILKLSNSDETMEAVMKIREKALMAAKNACARTRGVKFPPRGQWVNARNRFPNRTDGGNTSGPLIG